MKAKNLTNQLPTKRTNLNQVLPLNTPYVIQIFPIYACTFKCNYCIMSKNKKEHNFISDEIFLKYELFEKIVDDISNFENKIKVLRFVGIGEPLLHNKLVNMIEYVNKKQIAEKIEILTNGFLLTKKYSNTLIRSGLNRLVISLQGTSVKKYKEVCGKGIDFNKFIDNIKYFYDISRNKNINIYLKIVDTALKDEEDKESFYKIFGNMCDSIAIENTVPIHKNIEATDNLNKDVTQFGQKIEDVNICSQSFFHMQINPDGNVVPCYSWEYPVILGNVYKESLADIWNGNIFNAFRIKMLKNKNDNIVCKDCNMIKYRMSKEDIINENTKNKLLRFYGRNL